MNYGLCITLACLITCSIYAMHNSPNEVKNACKKEAFGTDRPTPFDKEITKRLEQQRKKDPALFNRMKQAASAHTPNSKKK